MNKANNLIVSLILGIAVLGLPTAARAAGAAQIERNVRAAARQLYANNPEARALAREAEAILIFPDIVKAGFVFGGSYGEGALLENGHISGFYTTAAASYGFQAGVGEVRLYTLLHGPRGVELSETEPRVSDRSRAVGDRGLPNHSPQPICRRVYAVFFNQQGLMAGAALQGSKITRIFP